MRVVVVISLLCLLGVDAARKKRKRSDEADSNGQQVVHMQFPVDDESLLETGQQSSRNEFICEVYKDIENANAEGVNRVKPVACKCGDIKMGCWSSTNTARGRYSCPGSVPEKSYIFSDTCTSLDSSLLEGASSIISATIKADADSKARERAARQIAQLATSSDPSTRISVQEHVKGDVLVFLEGAAKEKIKSGFATGMNGDEDLGEDIQMKGEPFHF